MAYYQKNMVCKKRREAGKQREKEKKGTKERKPNSEIVFLECLGTVNVTTYNSQEGSKV